MKHYKTLILTLSAILCASCTSNEYPSKMSDTPAPLLEDMKQSESPGEKIAKDAQYASIDYSNATLGYISAKRLMMDDTRVKLQIIKGEETYNYDLLSELDTTFPLQMGSGDYVIKIMKQVQNDTYAMLFSLPLSIQLESELLPFLYPNQIVPFTPESAVVKQAFELTKEDTNTIERVYSIYEYVIHNITYDDERALEVSGKFVLPDINQTLTTGKGICFDYASTLAAMLRSQQIPTRLITGYTEEEYHSWIEIWMENEGWIDPHVFFEKEEWSVIDPTYAAAKKDYEGVYETKYIY